ncbi:MAG: selenium metabolism-associated LysR family transcriptional regulator [bacterium]|nr:selenium metabolism-associated LysR family transcriptional regulator [bacterium]
MELRELKTFCVVVEKGSFSKAGEVVHLAQPTVSLQVKGLEDELGIKLLDRLDRKILPTPSGRILYHHAKGVLNKMEELKAELTESLGPKVKGRLTLGTGVTVGENIMPKLLGSFKENYPAVEIALRILDTSEITKQMLSNELDLGVVGAEVNHKDLVLEKFTSDRLILIVPPSHPWASREAILLSELAKEHLLVREEGSGTRMNIRQELKQRGIQESDLNIVMELGSSGAIKQAVMLGQGVSIANQQAVSSELESGLLVNVPIKDFALVKEFYLVLHRKRTRSIPLKSFLQFLKGYKSF